jgi:predicted RNase H-like HicB family nuclease
MGVRKSPKSEGLFDMHFCIETEQEQDGRWIAEITDIPGVLAYGETKEQAERNAYALALRVIADRVEQSSQAVPHSIEVTCA